MEYFIKKKKERKVIRTIMYIWAALEYISGVICMYFAYDCAKYEYSWDGVDAISWCIISMGVVVYASILFIITKFAIKPVVEASVVIQGIPVAFRRNGSNYDLMINGKTVVMKKMNITNEEPQVAVDIDAKKCRYAELVLEDGRNIRFVWVNADKHVLYIDDVLVVRNGFVIQNQKQSEQMFNNSIDNNVEDTVYFLKAITGSKQGSMWPLAGPLRIGRSPEECQIVFEQNTQGVSRMHCEVGMSGGKLYIKDLGATYGTMLSNGTLLKDYAEHELGENMIFMIGNDESFMVVRN